MGLFSFLKPKPPMKRTILADGMVFDLLLKSLQRRDSCKAITQKARLAMIRTVDVEDAELASRRPYVLHAWECEDIARSLVDAAQRRAASEGCSWAIGTLRAMPPPWVQAEPGSRHVYVWAVVQGSDGKPAVTIYDPTARVWVPLNQVRDVDYFMT